MLRKMTAFARREAVLSIAFVCAALSALAVPPDAGYAGYIDWRVLCMLFCLMGTVAGLPRLMDIGQCNDAYSAIQIAVALANAFGCGVNDLPLSMVLSWYEQKAVCILLTLLYLGIRNIRLGPTLPAFVSENVLNYLVENYHIAPITTPEEDMKALL